MSQRAAAKQKGFARIAPVVVILFLVASGALAAPQYQDRDHDRDHDRNRFGDRTIFILSYERTTRDFGGGNGGRPSPDAQCEPGFVAVGFHVQTGEFVNQAWLDCAPMRSDGSLGEERRITTRTGSPGGRPISDAMCPDGLALRGLRGRTGASIDEAAGECSQVREMSERDNPRTELTQPVMRPRPGGRPSEAQCPAGSVVTGFRSMSGEYMDHLWIVCSELRRTY
ncbi:MAG TPA: hypothetical protein VMH04_22475 [Candidatus Solibacter sp.]|nr:hypothetical protein [Candidatus Solibacter sp.]